MKIKRAFSGMGAALLCAFFLNVGVAPAAAATAYPGAVSCTADNATTRSITSAFGDHSVQHRAEGYAGYYYATFSVPWYASDNTRKKNWGFKAILSSRISTSATLHSAAIGCGL